MSLLPSVIALGLAALGALWLTLARASPQADRVGRRAAARALAVATAVQALHFAEETAGGFADRLGPLFGLPAMPLVLFLVFNLFWLAAWIASVWGIRASRPPAFFAAWFLAIAGIANGVAHPLLALAAGGYFPGLVTAPVVALACVWLAGHLLRATRWG